MGIAERERERTRLFRELAPTIVEALSRRDDGIAIANDLAGERGVDVAEMYRWVRHVEDEIERRRRRDAVPGIIALWLGGLLLIVDGVLVIVRGFSLPIILLGVAAVATFVFAWLFLRDLTARSTKRYLETV